MDVQVLRIGRVAFSSSTMLNLWVDHLQAQNSRSKTQLGVECAPHSSLVERIALARPNRKTKRPCALVRIIGIAASVTVSRYRCSTLSEQLDASHLRLILAPRWLPVRFPHRAERHSQHTIKVRE
jgi:hypothetical protein